jgi:hypothetical protein
VVDMVMRILNEEMGQSFKRGEMWF